MNQPGPTWTLFSGILSEYFDSNELQMCCNERYFLLSTCSFSFQRVILDSFNVVNKRVQHVSRAALVQTGYPCLLDIPEHKLLTGSLSEFNFKYRQRWKVSEFVRSHLSWPFVGDQVKVRSKMYHRDFSYGLQKKTKIVYKYKNYLSLSHKFQYKNTQLRKSVLILCSDEQIIPE